MLDIELVRKIFSVAVVHSPADGNQATGLALIDKLEKGMLADLQKVASNIWLRFRRRISSRVNELTIGDVLGQDRLQGYDEFLAQIKEFHNNVEADLQDFE